MSKKILAIVCIVVAVFGLSACNQKSYLKNSKTSNAQRQTAQKLVVKKLSETEKASAITVYAAMKYKKTWQTVYQHAVSHKLLVAVKNPTGFKNVKGKHYVYQVSNNSEESANFYTIDNQEVDFYHDKKIGSASLNEITSYLNNQNKIATVKKLAACTTVGASITSDKYGVKGDNGLANVPKNLQGIWYTRKGKRLIITAHTVDGEQIHQIGDSGIAAESFDQTDKWARARIENINGIDCYHVQSLNAQNFGLLYSVQKKGRDSAVVTYSVDTGNYIDSYWKSVVLAKIYEDADFASLK